MSRRKKKIESMDNLQKILNEYGDGIFEILPSEGSICRWKLQESPEILTVDSTQRCKHDGSVKPKETKHFNYEVRIKCTLAREQLRKGQTTKNKEISCIQSARITQEHSRRTVSGYIDRNIPLPGGGTRDVYNVTEDIAKDTREMQQMISKQQEIIAHQKDALDHMDRCFRDACTPDEYKLKQQIRAEVEEEFQKKITDLERKASEYETKYIELKNSLSNPTTPLECSVTETTMDTSWNPDHCDIADWKHVVHTAGGKIERIVDYFRRVHIAAYQFDSGICPCTHPTLVRIVSKKVVKLNYNGLSSAEYNVILQQRRTGHQCEVILLERYFDISWAPAYANALKEYQALMK